MIGEKRFFIKINEPEKGWVYFHRKGDFESDDLIKLRNENIPGDVIERARKSSYKEISKAEYRKIVNAINRDIDAAELIESVLNS